MRAEHPHAGSDTRCAPRGATVAVPAKVAADVTHTVRVQCSGCHSALVVALNRQRRNERLEARERSNKRCRVASGPATHCQPLRYRGPARPRRNGFCVPRPRQRYGGCLRTEALGDHARIERRALRAGIPHPQAAGPPTRGTRPGLRNRRRKTLLHHGVARRWGPSPARPDPVEARVRHRLRGLLGTGVTAFARAGPPGHLPPQHPTDKRRQSQADRLWTVVPHGAVPDCGGYTTLRSPRGDQRLEPRRA